MARAGNNMEVRAVIVQTFEQRFFDTKKDGKKGVLLNVVLDDGTETMRAVLFGEDIEKLGIDKSELLDIEKFNRKRIDLLGEEMLFSGNFRTNNYFNILEMNVNDVQSIDVSKLVKELEQKV